MSDVPLPHQTSFPGLSSLDDEIERLADAGAEERGAIFTRVEVVDFMLDLAGYTVARPLHELSILEPSFGGGDFLLVAVQRLLTSWKRHVGEAGDFTDLTGCVRAVELHRASVAETREKLTALLIESGADVETALRLARSWLISGDFLMTPLEPVFDLVIGNPPYIRQEEIPSILLAEYRRRYRTIYDRADLYVAFIERSLDLLRPGGTLSFICADRWMKNRYGGPLRRMVADRFNLRTYVDMVGTDAFHAEVSAYPAITVIANEPPDSTRVARRPMIERKVLESISKAMTAKKTPRLGGPVTDIPNVASGSEPWILDNFDQLAVVRRLESEFPALEDTGCKVGIGVATGADKAYIGLFDDLDVEPDRKLPLAMTRDISSGTVEWRGYGIVNPFEDSGHLIDLAEYPRTKRYLEARREQIAGRHVAKKAPARWYRTIDRITPSLATRPKLLIPDIKGEAHIVHESGNLYPHHNLYFIVSSEWDLKALRAVLLCGVARLFVSAYSTRMRGGSLRFQAQYLRRIRVPRWTDIAEPLRADLTRAAEEGDMNHCGELVARLYDLSREERAVMNGAA